MSETTTTDPKNKPTEYECPRCLTAHMTSGNIYCKACENYAKETGGLYYASMRHGGKGRQLR